MTIDKHALREVAEKAGRDKWQAKKINGDFCVIRRGSYEKQCGITSYQLVAEIDHKPVRDFVAMVNPWRRRTGISGIMLCGEFRVVFYLAGRRAGGLV